MILTQNKIYLTNRAGCEVAVALVAALPAAALVVLVDRLLRLLRLRNGHGRQHHHLRRRRDLRERGRGGRRRGAARQWRAVVGLGRDSIEN